jgi:hypothetical protein
MPEREQQPDRQYDTPEPGERPEWVTVESPPDPGERPEWPPDPAPNLPEPGERPAYP